MTWPYATPEELAVAVRTTVNDKNRDVLTRCVEAASEEIDEWIDWLPVVEPLIAPPPDEPPTPTMHSVAIVRGVQWYKANDSALGGVGFTETGTLNAPSDAFDQFRNVLAPLKQ